ncbi:vacuolar fusion protein MON1 homolog [Triticum aestivum]|uniref:vacuolar fusion protein MON1 homolog n=1 Tax=Triticum aestivum TaxID=4565 RepID=UPI001D025885|nr:vacuolar fusion protein MON1 homolog [Triticum aestivum]
MDPDPADENPLAALSLRGSDLPAHFAAGHEIDEEDEDDGYATAAARREGLDEGDGDAGPTRPRSSGYAGERGSSLASSTGAGGIEEPDASPPLGPGAEDWAQGKKHADEFILHW